MKKKPIAAISVLVIACLVSPSCVTTQSLNKRPGLSPGGGLQPVSYQDGNQKLRGLITPNFSKKLPGVIILPGWLGIDDEAKHAALGLEKQGYTALIADIYGAGNLPKNEKEASEKAAYYKRNYKQYQHRISLALDELIANGADAEKVAVVGYCFGGTGALEAARGNLPVEGIVSIHGGLYKHPDRINRAIHAKVLIEHPADDQSVPKEDVDNLIIEMNESNADWQIITYGNSKHTFTNPQSSDYNETMAKRAWQHTLLFLHDILGPI